jgi:four helix bundle protein
VVVASDFRRLRAYQLARALASELRDHVLHWPWIHQRTIGVQLLRSADSIAANIAEGTGRWYMADQRRLLYIARGSLQETEHWIAVAQEQGLLPPDASRDLPEIARTLNGLIKRRNR